MILVYYYLFDERTSVNSLKIIENFIQFKTILMVFNTGINYNYYSF